MNGFLKGGATPLGQTPLWSNILTSLIPKIFISPQETVCKDEYDKKCYIDYSQTAVNVDVEICQDNLVRDCDIDGEEICTDEHVTGNESSIRAR